jgi:hypothetical protein
MLPSKTSTTTGAAMIALLSTAIFHMPKAFSDAPVATTTLATTSATAIEPTAIPDVNSVTPTKAVTSVPNFTLTPPVGKTIPDCTSTIPEEGANLLRTAWTRMEQSHKSVEQELAPNCAILPTLDVSKTDASLKCPTIPKEGGTKPGIDCKDIKFEATFKSREAEIRNSMCAVDCNGINALHLKGKIACIVTQIAAYKTLQDEFVQKFNEQLNSAAIGQTLVDMKNNSTQYENEMKSMDTSIAKLDAAGTQLRAEQTSLPTVISEFQTKEQSYNNWNNIIASQKVTNRVARNVACLQRQPLPPDTEGIPESCRADSSTSATAVQLINCAIKNYNTQDANNVKLKDAMTLNDASKKETGIGGYLDLILSQTPNMVGYPVSSDPEAIKAFSSQNLTYPTNDALMSAINAKFSTFRLKNTTVAAVFAQAMQICDAQTVTEMANEDSKGPSGLNQAKLELAKSKTALDSEYDVNYNRISQLYATGMGALTGQNTALVNPCAGKITSDSSCLKNILSLTNGLLNGTGRNSQRTVTFGAQKVACRGLTDCQTQIQTKKDAVSTAKDRNDAAITKYTQDTNNLFQAQTKAMAMELKKSSDILTSKIAALGKDVGNLEIDIPKPGEIAGNTADTLINEDGKINSEATKEPLKTLAGAAGPLLDASESGQQEALKSATAKVTELESKSKTLDSDLITLKGKLSECRSGGNLLAFAHVNIAAQQLQRMGCGNIPDCATSLQNLTNANFEIARITGISASNSMGGGMMNGGMMNGGMMNGGMMNGGMMNGGMMNGGMMNGGMMNGGMMNGGMMNGGMMNGGMMNGGGMSVSEVVDTRYGKTEAEIKQTMRDRSAAGQDIYTGQKRAHVTDQDRVNDQALINGWVTPCASAKGQIKTGENMPSSELDGRICVAQSNDLEQKANKIAQDQRDIANGVSRPRSAIGAR